MQSLRGIGIISLFRAHLRGIGIILKGRILLKVSVSLMTCRPERVKRLVFEHTSNVYLKSL